MNTIMLAGTGSGCGKTTITCALLAALKNNGKKAASFKCGPDYIDPMFHKKAGLADSYNLDIFLMGGENVKRCLYMHGYGADICVIEGVMGLYDGTGGSGFASSNHVSLITGAPTILIVNVKGKAQSVCAEIKGYLEYEKNNIRAVIINNCSEAMYPFYKDMIEKKLSLPVAGFMPNVEAAVFESRHLGLIQASEIADVKLKIKTLAENAAKYFDMDMIYDISANCDKSVFGGYNNPEGLLPKGVRAAELIKKPKIYIAQDEAFTFFYEDNHYLLKRLGADLRFFSPLHDKELPNDADGLILWGGYPELYAKQLSENTGMRNSVKNKIKSGTPVYAECGGFIYLHEFFHLQDEAFEMAGVIKGGAKMGTRLNNFGYAELTANKDTFLVEKGGKIGAHSFHYSYSDNEGDCFTAQKTSGKKYGCIIADNNIFAGYPHLHFWGCGKLAENFIKATTEVANEIYI